MNVLLITFSFPPAGGVGVLRALSLAKYLPENGVRVDVLTARNVPAVGRDPALLAQVPTHVTVHSTLTLDLPFEQRKWIKKLVSSGSKGRRPSGNKERGGLRNMVSTLLGNLLLPDPQLGWLPFAFPAAKRIIRERKIDLVLLTVPPYSSVYLVAKLRRVFPTLPIVLDFRDEWLTTTIDLVSFSNNERARRIAHRAEAECVHHATTIVAVTEAARMEMQGRYPAEDPGKFRYIPNGFDLEPRPMTPRTSGDPAKVVMTFLGSIYRSTDPDTLVDAVLGLPAELRARLHLRFIGRIETAEQRESLLRLGDTVELKGFLPQAEALTFMQDSDYLLLISHDRINVSAKFYDYLAGGKPIFAIIHPAGDIRLLLDRTRAGVWADSEDPAAIRTLLAKVLDPAASSTESLQPDAVCIASFHRRAITQRYAELLREAAGL